ncbi:MAG TPA: cytochrome c [Bryobacteraceae bacterium]|jgi:hypothetical protein|nr:cytochrome c [Bryobacteraceae bacterium]
MKRLLLIFGVSIGVSQAHDIITTAITYDREIIRIMQARCLSCHHPDGVAFSLTTYTDARPWAEAIKEEVLGRTMPPWGAIKGFGDFRNDQALTPEQIELIESWADGGVPEGEPADLPTKISWDAVPTFQPPHGALKITGDFKVNHGFTLDGLYPENVPEKVSARITVEFPDGTVEPMLWLKDYRAKYAHPFLLRTPLDLPAGTFIRGMPEGATLWLLPPDSAAAAKAAETPPAAVRAQ